jgi:hypothetical protein
MRLFRGGHFVPALKWLIVRGGLVLCVSGIMVWSQLLLMTVPG